MRIIHIFDIDTTVANNDARAKCLVANCVQCGRPCESVNNNRIGDWVCSVCGPTSGKVPQSAWDTFTTPEHMAHDLPYPEAQKYMNQLIATGAEIHFLTGRREACREVTTQWLKDHYCFDPNRSYLVMRGPETHSQPASVYKEQAFQALAKKIGADIKNDLFYFFEDDKFVFSMYSKYGIVMQSPEVFFCMNPTGSPRDLESRWNR